MHISLCQYVLNTDSLLEIGLSPLGHHYLWRYLYRFCCFIIIIIDSHLLHTKLKAKWMTCKIMNNYHYTRCTVSLYLITLDTRINLKSTIWNLRQFEISRLLSETSPPPPPPLNLSRLFWLISHPLPWTSNLSWILPKRLSSNWSKTKNTKSNICFIIFVHVHTRVIYWQVIITCVAVFSRKTTWNDNYRTSQLAKGYFYNNKNQVNPLLSRHRLVSVHFLPAKIITFKLQRKCVSQTFLCEVERF